MLIRYVATATRGPMTNWLTTHYPHPVLNDHLWHIYLQRDHKDAVRGIAVGDRVFFYEFKRQKALKSGVKHPTGAQGIVRIAYVSGGMYHRDTVVEHADGKVAYWSWGVPTDREDVSGFVKREDVLRVIDYAPGSYLFGFNSGAGVKRLDDGQGRELSELFKAGVGRRPGVAT
jgi:hypothetical protein